MLYIFREPSQWLFLLSISHFVTAVHSLALSSAGPTVSLNKRDEITQLSILPLGGSITLGWGSSTGNGWRKPLRDQLRKDGFVVDMVGTTTGGTNADVTGTVMTDNNVSAEPGYVVSDIEGLLEASLQYLPNLVLVNAGVNDCAKGVDIPGISTRMNSLLDTAFDNIPGTTVILSTLLPSLNASLATCHDDVNAQFRSLVTTRSASGDKIVLAEMAPDTVYWDEVIGGDYYDSTHPADSGHAKMASIWYQAVTAANDQQLVTAPAAYDADAEGDDADTLTSPDLPAAPSST